MRKLLLAISLMLLSSISLAQNVGVGVSNPTSRFQINHNSATTTGLSIVDTLGYGIGSLKFRNYANPATTSMQITGYSAGRYNALQYLDIATDSLAILSIRGTGQVGVKNADPVYTLDVAGDVNTTGALRVNGNAGTAGQLLQSNGDNTMTWANAAAGAGSGGSVGFGPWGDCSTNAISEYNPVADENAVDATAFGHTVAVSGNYAIVGAFFDLVGPDRKGSASIYQFNGSNWVFMQKIIDATGSAGDYFGSSVSISGNYAIVGASYDDIGANADQGSASIYQFNGSNWVLMQKITDGTGAAGDVFGYSVSISGNYAIIGAYIDDVGANANQGSVSIYRYNGSSWVLMNKITDATGSAAGRFGYSVSLSGNYAIVGAAFENIGGNVMQGSASIYQFDGSNWVLMNKITNSAGAADDRFGYGVSISGNYAIVGAFGDDVGANSNQGSASIYRYNGSNWVLMNKLTDAAGTASDVFGCSVSISGNYAVVGAYLKKVGGNVDQGAASIYQRVGLGWQKVQYVTDPGGNQVDHFGISVGIDATNKRFLSGVEGHAGSSGKVIFGKLNF